MILALFSGCEASVFYIASNILIKLPEHAATPKTSLHPIWDHFIEPFDRQNYSKFLDRNDVCEASTILVNPFGMSFLQHFYMSIS